MTESEALAQLRSIPEPKAGERTCAICLAPIARIAYNSHMRDAHGYEVQNFEATGGPVVQQARFLANNQGIATDVPNPDYVERS